jgi:hypothetical protein
MQEIPRFDQPRVGLGMASLVLGVIGMLLFFLPVLGIPISVCGLLAGLVGVPVAICFRLTLRWCAAGIAMCALALLVNLAVAYAPSGYIPLPRPPRLWQTAPGELYAPLPAKAQPITD